MGGRGGRHRLGVLRQVPYRRPARAVLRSGGAQGDRRRSGQGRPRAQHRDGLQRPSLRRGRPPRGDGSVVHDELPRSGRQGAPRADRDRARRDHHHPRRHQHPGRGRRTAQGPASGPLGPQLTDPDLDRLSDSHHDDLPRTHRQTEWPRSAGSVAERLAHRRRVHHDPRRHRRGDQRAPARRRRR